MINITIEKTEEINKNKNLPQGWVQCELGEIFMTSSGGTPKRGNSSYYGGSIPWVKSGDLNKGVITTAQEFITEDGLNNSSAKLFPKGSLLIALYGATIGKLAFLGIDATTNQAVCCIYKNDNYNMDLLFYYLTLKKDFIIKLGKGGAQPNISQEIVKALNLPVPPLAEQERIVEKIEELFSDIDDGVKTLEKIKLQIKQYRQSVLKSAFEGKLYKTTEWKSLKVKDIGKVKGGKRLPAGSNYADEITDYPYIRVTNFDNMTVNVADIKYLTQEIQSKIKNYTISKNDVYISIAGSIGKVGTIPDVLDNANLTENAAKIVHNMNKKYLVYYLNSTKVQHQIASFTKSTTQPKLALYRIEEIDIEVPLIPEQEKIVEEIEKRFEVADILEQAVIEGLEKAKQLKQSILKKAFEGKLVPQNPSDEPASVLLEKIKSERGE